MKLHLPVKLHRAMQACFVAGITFAYPFSYAATVEEEDELFMSLSEVEYPKGSRVFTKRQTSSLTLDGYEKIMFHDIKYTTTSSHAIAYGGAIFNNTNATFTLSDNGNVAFSGNLVSTTSGYSSSSTSAYGGAIYNDTNASFTLSGNGNVTFSGSVASSSSAYSYTYGGAIYNNTNATFTLSDNGNVTFSGNSASTTSAFSNNAHGGAIHNNCGTFTLRGNGEVTFSGNAASSTSTSSQSDAYGGAIHNDSNNSTFTLSDNGNVTFSGNSVSATNSYSHTYGGAIFNNTNATFTLSGNGEVTFSGNSASSISSTYAYGGAIYNYGTFTLSGNGDVLFEKNVEKNGITYRLRSIYTASWSTLNLAASEGKSIIFRDSVYAQGTVTLNQDYTDAVGVVHKSTGDIIFTGATTEGDMLAVKGSAGTAAEIDNSRTSEIATMATLYGGRLLVEDKAVLKVDGLFVAGGASVVVKNGSLMLNSGNAAVTTAEGAEKAVLTGASLGASSLEGEDGEHRGTVAAAWIDLAEGTTFSMQHLVLAATTRITDDPAMLKLDDVTAELVMGVNTSLTGSDLLLAGTTLAQSGNTGVTLTLSSDASVLMLESTTFDSLTLSGSTLVLELAGMTLEMFDNAELIAVSFTSGTDYATFDKSLAVTLSVDGINYERGYTMDSDDTPTTMYFRGGKKPAPATPEPATTTLSLLSLAALAARRRRK